MAAGTRECFYVSDVFVARIAGLFLSIRRPCGSPTIQFDRCKIEKVFGWWKWGAGSRRLWYVGHERNRLQLEFKSICWNLKRLANLSAA